MATEAQEMGSFEAKLPENRVKRTATGGYPPVNIPSGMDTEEKIEGYDPIANPGSQNPGQEMVETLSKDKQGLGKYDYGVNNAETGI